MTILSDFYMTHVDLHIGWELSFLFKVTIVISMSDGNQRPIPFPDKQIDQLIVPGPCFEDTSLNIFYNTGLTKNFSLIWSNTSSIVEGNRKTYRLRGKVIFCHRHSDPTQNIKLADSLRYKTLMGKVF